MRGFAYVDFESVAVCSVGVAIRINKVGTPGYGIGPFYGVIEMFVEESDRYLFAFCGIPFVTQVDVLHIAGT